MSARFCVALAALLLLGACASSAPATAPPPSATSPFPRATDTPAPPTADPTSAPTATPPSAPTLAPTAVPPAPTPTVPADEGALFAYAFGGPRRDRGIDVIETEDGGFAVVGYSGSFGAEREDIYLVRLDAGGELLWQRTYGGARDENGWAVVETAAGGFLVAGFTNSAGAGGMDIYLLAVDMAGELLWERTYGGPEDEFGWDMAASADGGYLIVGQSASAGAGEEDGLLLKVDATGEEMWRQSYGGADEDRLFSIALLADGRIVLAGTTRSFGAGQRDAYVLLVDGAGVVLQEHILGGAEDDVAHAVRPTADGGFVVTGYTRSNQARDYEVWLQKFDVAGEREWEAFAGGSEEDRALYGEQTADGGYIVTGRTRSFGAAGWDVLLLGFSPAGAVLWQETLGGPAEDTGYTVRVVDGRGYIITGETYSFGAGNGDMYVILVDEATTPTPTLFDLIVHALHH